MEALQELFDTSKPFERVRVPGGQTEGYVDAPHSDDEYDLKPTQQDLKRQRLEVDQRYAVPYQLQEEQSLEAGVFEDPSKDMASSSGGMLEMEGLSSMGTTSHIDDLTAEKLTRVYDLYDFKKPGNNLPISPFREKITAMAETYQVLVIEGPTGCGKTTQVAQYILDRHRDNGRPCNIVVTQPRRIAAISIAQRVAHERGWPLGSIVGYTVGLRSETSEDTRLLYCTTGVLLQKLIANRHMNDYTHVIIDEVHERDQELDFLLLLVRTLHRTNSRGVKVILMSATFNSERFAEYFQCVLFNQMQNAPILHIEKKPKFRVSEYYLNDLQSLAIDVQTELEPVVTSGHHRLTKQLIEIFDKIESEEQQQKVPQAGSSKDAGLVRGAVLVFLPGIYEIEDLYDRLSGDSQKYKWTIMPLHSSITSEEQSAVFKHPPPGYRKIILSTNIAESSITVPDIKYVIDYCMSKQLMTDPTTNFTSLQLTWSSKTNCIQRSGRAGRLSSGRVYRLIRKEQYPLLLEEPEPEMLRCPLERLVLMCKVLGDDKSPKAMLARVMDPPDLGNLQNTVKLLKEAGGLINKVANPADKEDGDITFLGRVMARLPVNIHVSKMIMLGHIFSVLDDCIIMGAAMTVKNMFAAPFRERLKAYVSKLSWSVSSSSDCIAFLNAFTAWRTRTEQGYFERTRSSSEREWAERNFIQLRSMWEVSEMVEELRRRLKNLGIESMRGPDICTLTENEKPLVLKIVIAGAFYPNYFVRGSQGGQIDEKEAVRLLVGRDPYSTVYLSNFPLHQPGEIYTRPVKELMAKCSTNCKVSFDSTTKIFIEFPRDDLPMGSESQPYPLRMPGRVAFNVYKAVKMRQLCMPLKLRVLPQYQAERMTENREVTLLALNNRNEKLQEHKQLQQLRSRWGAEGSSSSAAAVPLTRPRIKQKPRSRLPGLDISHLHIQICHVKDPGRFWAHMVSSDVPRELGLIYHKLNREPESEPDGKNVEVVQLTSTPKVGQMVVAPYFEKEHKETKLYRGRVTAIVRVPGQEQLHAKIFFVDYGNSETLPVKELLDYGPQLVRDGFNTRPGLAIECVLSEVQPSLVRSSGGKWLEAAVDYFRSKVLHQNIYASIYSVVNSVVALELYDSDSVEGNKTINIELIKMGFAQFSEESYLSKANHEVRMQHRHLSVEQVIVYEEQQHSNLGVEVEEDPIPPKISETTRTVDLKGPYSPLEMNVYHLIRAGHLKTATVDSTSVNSVLIDDDPQDRHERMVVAGMVQASPDNTRLTLRQTTVLPNIAGLPALVCLIFGPHIELRVNHGRSRVTGMLCGLGYNEYTKRANFPDHDMEIAFDTIFTMADLQDVNRLRFWMNVALHTESKEIQPSNGRNDIIKYQNKAKKFLFKLLNKSREFQEPTQHRKPFRWGQLDHVPLLYPGDSNMKGRDIFPLIWGIDLEREGAVEMLEMSQHVRALLDIVKRDEPVSDVTCRMCKVTMHSLMELRLHLNSTRHDRSEQRIHLSFGNNEPMDEEEEEEEENEKKATEWRSYRI